MGMLVAVSAGALFIAVFVISTMIGRDNNSRGRYIDCSLAEFSPDFTKEMREQCRKIRRVTV